jgi:hypothetical protein
MYDANNTVFYADLESTTRLNELQSNRTYAFTDVRSPIYYDYDNTGYYLDLSNVSNASMNCTGLWYFRSNRNTTSDSPPLQAYSNDGGGAIMSFHRGGYYAVNMGLDSDNVFRIGGWSAGANRLQLDMSSNLYLVGSVRAPIFYDQDNTAYYVDPNSTTAIRTVGSWRADSAAWDGEFAGKIQYHSSIWYFQASGWQFRNSGGSQVLYCDSSGNLTCNGNVTAYSDRRLKSNIITLDSASKYLNLIEAKRFTWTTDGRADIGFIAQDVEEAGLPEFVLETEQYDPNTGSHSEAIKSLDYGRMVAVLWQAVKELKSELDEVKLRIH